VSSPCRARGRAPACSSPPHLIRPTFLARWHRLSSMMKTMVTRTKKSQCCPSSPPLRCSPVPRAICTAWWVGACRAAPGPAVAPLCIQLYTHTPPLAQRPPHNPISPRIDALNDRPKSGVGRWMTTTWYGWVVVRFIGKKTQKLIRLFWALQPTLHIRLRIHTNRTP